MITARWLRDQEACWTDAEIASHLGSRVGMTPREITADETISLDDRLWVVCRALWSRSEAAARTFAIDSAALVSHLAGNERGQAEHARLLVELRRIFALPPGADRSVELARWASAWASAWDSARASAWDSARASARASAWTSAWDSARDSARDSAWASAWDSARDSAWASAWASSRASARDSAWDSAIKKAIARAIAALGPDADGWAQ